jgi:hypothetical protein
MIVAKIYPEPEKGGRGKPSSVSKEFRGLSATRISLHAPCSNSRPSWQIAMIMAKIYPEPAKLKRKNSGIYILNSLAYPAGDIVHCASDMHGDAIIQQRRKWDI